MLPRLERFLSTPPDSTLLVARVTAGAVIFPHGAQKLLGWFGGRGFEATMSGMQSHLGLPAFVVFLVIVAESLGALGLVFGLGARLAAFGVGLTMLGAMTRHLDHGFFMNWAGRAAGEGYEFHLLVIGLVIPVLVKGAGAFSLDRAIAARLDEAIRP